MCDLASVPDTEATLVREVVAGIVLTGHGSGRAGETTC
jgi:hypothetical protein